MILPIHRALRARITEVLIELYGLDRAALPPLVVGVPPNRTLGDLAFPFAFELARTLRKAPRVIAREVVAALGPVPGVARVEATDTGYVNAFLDRPAFLRSRLADATAAAGVRPEGQDEKVIVEHTAINPNKAAHIGHLRNAALGDTLVRMLAFSGTPVEVQNYIDDTGVQVADVVVGFVHLEHKSVDEVRVLADTTRFDYHCWDLYARVTEWYEADRERLALRAAALADIEHGTGEMAALGQLIAERIVRAHLQTMRRLNVDYDLLTWEGDILRLRFWATCFEILKQSGSVFFQTEGRLAGCWVMRIDEEAGAGEPSDSPADEGNEEDEERREKVIVRSNGTVTYVGKDIAYQFWKLGLLGIDFRYRPFATRADGTALWATTSDPAAPQGGEAGVPRFGHADATYNVIDSRQSYLQKLLKQALATLGHAREAQRSTHFAYEMVALSHATARELGYDVADQADRPFVEVSGRKGLGVKADDLIDRLTEKARHEVELRNADLPAEAVEHTARAIAVAALRYFMVKFSRSKIIAFDIDEALSFEGETGPYLQYAAVRAANIFNKLRERHGVGEGDLAGMLEGLDAAPLTASADGDELWGLVLEAARLDEMVEQSIRTLEPALLAKYAFGLAQAFNAFYHRAPILNEEDATTRWWRAAVAAYSRRQIAQALQLIGSSVPSRM